MLQSEPQHTKVGDAKESFIFAGGAWKKVTEDANVGGSKEMYGLLNILKKTNVNRCIEEKQLQE